MPDAYRQHPEFKDPSPRYDGPFVIEQGPWGILATYERELPSEYRKAKPAQTLLGAKVDCIARMERHIRLQHKIIAQAQRATEELGATLKHMERNRDA